VHAEHPQQIQFLDKQAKKLAKTRSFLESGDNEDDELPSPKKAKVAAKPAAPKVPKADKPPKKVPASHKTCKHCGKTLAPKSFATECPATKQHTGEWDYDYDPPWKQRMRIEKGMCMGTCLSLLEIQTTELRSRDAARGRCVCGEKTRYLEFEAFV